MKRLHPYSEKECNTCKVSQVVCDQSQSAQCSRPLLDTSSSFPQEGAGRGIHAGDLYFLVQRMKLIL